MDQIAQTTWTSHEQTWKCNNARVGRNKGVAAVYDPFQITTMEAGTHERCTLCWTTQNDRFYRANATESVSQIGQQSQHSAVKQGTIAVQFID
jgi:hypothetical protein